MREKSNGRFTASALGLMCMCTPTYRAGAHGKGRRYCSAARSNTGSGRPHLIVSLSPFCTEKTCCLLTAREAWNSWQTVSLQAFPSSPSWLPLAQALAKASCGREKGSVNSGFSTQKGSADRQHGADICLPKSISRTGTSLHQFPFYFTN